MKRRSSWSGRRAAQAWCSTLTPSTGKRRKEVCNNSIHNRVLQFLLDEMLIMLMKCWLFYSFFFLDFDEQTADDWDVDMSVYYDKGISALLYICDHLDWRREANCDFSLQSPIFFNPALALTDGGDMDARDYVRMRHEKRLREGLEDRSVHSQTIGSFERFTKVGSWHVIWLLSFLS